MAQAQRPITSASATLTVTIDGRTRTYRWDDAQVQLDHAGHSTQVTITGEGFLDDDARALGPLLDAETAALVAGRSRSTIQRWVNSGRLANFGSTRRLLVRHAQLLDVLDAAKSAA